MEHRDDWIRELERRQDNIDPIRRIPNYALFQGTLINGNLRLSRLQRAGAVFLGFCGLSMSCFLLASVVADLRAGLLPDLSYTLYCPFSFWIGWSITNNALINDTAKARHKKVETTH